MIWGGLTSYWICCGCKHITPNQKIEEVKMTRCLPICERKIVVKENIEKKTKVGRRVRVIKKIEQRQMENIDKREI